MSLKKIKLLEFDGVQLPIFNTDDVLWEERQFRLAAKSGLEKFVRIARPWGYNPELSIGKRLSHVDRALGRISVDRNIVIVNHTWGVCEDNGEFSDYPRDDAAGLLPKGLLLVAEVSSVNELTPSEDSYQDLFKYFQNTEKIDSLVSEEGITTPLSDIDIDQVVFGRQLSHPQLAPKWVYVDIDPILNAPSNE